MQKNKPSQLALKRMRLGLEQKQIASLLGDQSIFKYNRLENGQTVANLKDAIKLSLIFRLPISTLFDEHFDKCKKELEKCLSSSLLGNRIFLEDAARCSYLEMMSSEVISPENANKIRHHVKVLVEERSNKILEK
jgi:DNA-binding XRE family transcriptional regulator